MKTIKLGSTGVEVLRLCNCLDLPESTEFTESIQDKVIKFQKSHNLTPDGIVGPKSWLVLLVEDRKKHNSSSDICESDFIIASWYLDCDIPSIRAVLEVETSGKSGFVVPGKPKILFEGHIFWKELKSRGIDPEKYSSLYPSIVYPKWTKQYYLGGIREYERFDQASLINRDAAIESVSVGLFQILGQNYKACSCSSPSEFWKKMCESEFDQFILGIEFIRTQGLYEYLKDHQWVRFAEKYNGPLQAQNKYSDKLEKSWRKYNK